MPSPVRLILASGSPRRRELLAAVGIPFRVVPPDVDETPVPGESPARFVRRAALDKGAAVSARFPSSFVLSADTIVVSGGRILGKPRNRGEARRMLARLSGGEHRVHTAVCLLCPERAYRDIGSEVTRVRFRPLSAEEVAAYVRTGECDDKAGAYSAQGAGMLLIDRVAGSFTNVVGLPMARVLSMLRRARLIRVSPRGPGWYAHPGADR
ncbi:MAG: Maf family protein [Deltaproteobacteria bacterium]